MFTHLQEISLPYDDINTDTVDGKRVYLTPDGNRFVSITSMLGHFGKKDLQAWRDRVGEQEANRVSRQASGRGTEVHELIEDYINNKEINEKRLMPHIKANFKSIKKLVNNINNVHFQEVALYSNKLSIAGRVDCIAEYNGVLSIIDFKTASKPKKFEWIHNYFMQGAFYACALYEQTGVMAKQIVILIAVDDNPPQEFIVPVGDWVKPLIETRRQFKSETGL